VVRVGILLMLAGIVVLLSGVSLDSDAAVVSVPMLLVGLGIGALSSQLGAVTVSAVPTEESGEVGGLQNTATNLGASLGTALAGSVLISILTASLVAGIQQNPDVPDQVKDQAGVELASGVPFLSDSALEQAMQDAGVDPTITEAVVEENRVARIDGLEAALATLAILAVVALFFTGRIPRVPPGSTPETATDTAVAGPA
jgi:hypothetical protein